VDGDYNRTQIGFQIPFAFLLVIASDSRFPIRNKTLSIRIRFFPAIEPMLITILICGERKHAWATMAFDRHISQSPSH